MKLSDGTPKRLVHIRAPFYVVELLTSSHSSRNYSPQPCSHLKATETRHNMPTYSVAYNKHQFCVFSMRATSAEGSAANRTGEYESPANTENIQSELRQARTFQSLVCTRQFSFHRATTTINLSSWMSHRRGIYEDPISRSGHVPRHQRGVWGRQDLSWRNRKHDVHELYSKVAVCKRRRVQRHRQENLKS